MGSHPINLALRFALELAALAIMGFWGWRQGEGWLRFILAVSVPLVFAVLWGVFAVPDDPSRSGSAPIPVPGLLRLLLELAFFTLGAWMLHRLGFAQYAAVFYLTVVFHYLISYDRISWLLRQ